MQNQKDIYEKKWNERYSNHYSKHPLMPRNQELKQKLADTTDHLKQLESELRQRQADIFRMKCERSRRNVEESGFYPLEHFIVQIANLRLETSQIVVVKNSVAGNVVHLSSEIRKSKAALELLKNIPAAESQFSGNYISKIPPSENKASESNTTEISHVGKDINCSEKETMNIDFFPDTPIYQKPLSCNGKRKSDNNQEMAPPVKALKSNSSTWNDLFQFKLYVPTFSLLSRKSDKSSSKAAPMVTKASKYNYEMPLEKSVENVDCSNSEIQIESSLNASSMSPPHNQVAQKTLKLQEQKTQQSPKELEMAECHAVTDNVETENYNHIHKVQLMPNEAQNRTAGNNACPLKDQKRATDKPTAQCPTAEYKVQLLMNQPTTKDNQVEKNKSIGSSVHSYIHPNTIAGNANESRPDARRVYSFETELTKVTNTDNQAENERTTGGNVHSYKDQHMTDLMGPRETTKSIALTFEKQLMCKDYVTENRNITASDVSSYFKVTGNITDDGKIVESDDCSNKCQPMTAEKEYENGTNIGNVMTVGRPIYSLEGQPITMVKKVEQRETIGSNIYPNEDEHMTTHNQLETKNREHIGSKVHSYDNQHSTTGNEIEKQIFVKDVEPSQNELEQTNVDLNDSSETLSNSSPVMASNLCTFIESEKANDNENNPENSNKSSIDIHSFTIPDIQDMTPYVTPRSNGEAANICPENVETNVPDNIGQGNETPKPASPFDFQKHMEALKEMKKSPVYKYPTRFMYEPPAPEQATVSKDDPPMNQPGEKVSFEAITSFQRERVSKTGINYLPMDPVSPDKDDNLSFCFEDYLNDSPPSPIKMGKEKSMFSFGGASTSKEVPKSSNSIFQLFGAGTADTGTAFNNAQSGFTLNFGSNQKQQEPNKTFKLPF